MAQVLARVSWRSVTSSVNSLACDMATSGKRVSISCSTDSAWFGSSNQTPRKLTLCGCPKRA